MTSSESELEQLAADEHCSTASVT